MTYEHIYHHLRATYEQVRTPHTHGFSLPLVAYACELGIPPDHMRMALMYLNQQNRLLAHKRVNPSCLLEWWDVDFLDEQEHTSTTHAAATTPEGVPS